MWKDYLSDCKQDVRKMLQEDLNETLCDGLGKNSTAQVTSEGYG